MHAGWLRGSWAVAEASRLHRWPIVNHCQSTINQPSSLLGVIDA
jgi:hypothetical protein